MSVKAPPPLIYSQIKYLSTKSPLPFKIEQLRSGDKIGKHSDRFTLQIPFCLDYIKWDVIYNAQYPLVAPDFIFSPEDEDFHPLLFGDKGRTRFEMGSLCNWNIKDPSRLLLVVNELRKKYLDYQKKRVAELDDDRLKFEISTLLSREGLEVLLLFASDRPQEVKFAIPLLENIPLNKIVQCCPWKQEQKIYLQAIFPITQKYSAPSAPRLNLVCTSELKIVFSIDDVKLPIWINGMCMAEYLPNLENSLEAQILAAGASIGARRRFIEALAPVFGRPVEADSVYCRRATVLVAGTFSFLVHFALTPQFPKQQPILTMQSSCHFTSQGTPISSPSLRTYPWSPRWEPSIMVERIFEYIGEELLTFKKYCNENSSQR
ncbi:BRCA1-A complex subunit BRE [Zostera marina]|uniref:BRISC and BRCA1-A complex member 2 n=1 Tax=Zostera marina TaxID=29655 RepID=A0A0K9P587_ZOSMR|nr:BRCA1-A complex subunit BRE [Zostera marina]